MESSFFSIFLFYNRKKALIKGKFKLKKFSPCLNKDYRYVCIYVCNKKEEAIYNREKRILFPTKLQNIDALKRNRKHSRKPENVLLLCIIFGLSFHPINYHPQMLCFYYRMLENYSEISVSLVKSWFRDCYLSSLFG